MSKPKKSPKVYDRAAFRDELRKRMPGLKWTVENPSSSAAQLAEHPEWDRVFVAHGMEAAGFNRVTSMDVWRRVNDKGEASFTSKISGTGLRSPWAREGDRGRDDELSHPTLAQSLRALQEHLESRAAHYGSLAGRMQTARVELRTETPDAWGIVTDRLKAMAERWRITAVMPAETLAVGTSRRHYREDPDGPKVEVNEEDPKRAAFLLAHELGHVMTGIAKDHSVFRSWHPEDGPHSFGFSQLSAVGAPVEWDEWLAFWKPPQSAAVNGAPPC